jgi:hypothetical protein
MNRAPREDNHSSTCPNSGTERVIPGSCAGRLAGRDPFERTREPRPFERGLMLSLALTNDLE